VGLLFEMVKKKESYRDQEWTYSQENTNSMNVQELSTLYDYKTENFVSQNIKS
jgi:hypothetical protein